MTSFSFSHCFFLPISVSKWQEHKSFLLNWISQCSVLKWNLKRWKIRNFMIIPWIVEFLAKMINNIVNNIVLEIRVENVIFADTMLDLCVWKRWNICWNCNWFLLGLHCTLQPLVIANGFDCMCECASARARTLWAKCFLVKFMSTFSLNMHCTVPNRAGIAFTSFVELTLFIEHRRKIIYRSRCFWLLSTCNKHFLTRWHPNLLMKHTKLQLFCALCLPIARFEHISQLCYWMCGDRFFAR